MLMRVALGLTVLVNVALYLAYRPICEYLAYTGAFR